MDYSRRTAHWSKHVDRASLSLTFVPISLNLYGSLCYKPRLTPKVVLSSEYGYSSLYLFDSFTI